MVDPRGLGARVCGQRWRHEPRPHHRRVGKSTVLEVLRARGYACIDMDDASLSFLDDAGHQHWRIDVLVQLLEAHPERTT